MSEGIIVPHSTQPTSPLHSAALAYAKAGIPVFPCEVNGKRPANEHSFDQATTDPAEINRIWSEADYNIGVCPEQIGLAVVDPDEKDGKNGIANWNALCAQYGGVPITFTVRTPTAGLHLYFKGSMGSSVGRLAPGVDTRGRRGYVVVPPSVVGGTAYEAVNSNFPPEEWEVADLPAWVGEKLATADRPKLVAPEGFQLDDPRDIEEARSRLRAMVTAGDVAIEGQAGNDRTYRLAAELKDLGVSPETSLDLLLREWNGHCLPPWEEDELAAIVEHAWRYKQNEAGCKAVSTIEDEWESHREEWTAYAAQLPAPPAALEPQAPENGAHTGKLSFKDALDGLGVNVDAIEGSYRRPPDPPLFLTAAELAVSDYPPPEYLWDKFLLRRDVNLLYGDGKTGKTTLALHVAVAVAGGLTQLFGHGIGGQQPVLVVLAEDDFGAVKRSLTAICNSLGQNLAELPITLCCRPRRDLCLAIVADDGTWQPGPFLKPLCEQLAAIGECLLVLDPVTTVAVLDEKLRPPPHTLCQVVFDGFAHWFGATVLVNAHPSKAGMRDGSGTSGATSWRNAVRNLLTLKRQDDIRVLSVGAGSYGDDGLLNLQMAGPVFSITSKPGSPETARKTLIRDVLAVRSAYGFRGGLTEAGLAEELAGRRPPDDAVEELAAWKTRREQERTALKNAHSKPLWRDLCGQQVPTGGDKQQWRWYLPEAERPGEDEF